MFHLERNGLGFLFFLHQDIFIIVSCTTIKQTSPALKAVPGKYLPVCNIRRKLAAHIDGQGLIQLLRLVNNPFLG